MTMTLGAAFIEGAGTLDTNVLTYNSLTAGRGLVACVLYQDFGVGESISSITVSGESNMTLVGTPVRNASSSWNSQIGYLSTLSAGGSKTITISLGGGQGNNSYAFIFEVHDGSGGGISVDGTGNAQGSTANPTVNVTTGSNNSAIFAVLEEPTGTPSAGSGYTLANSTAWYNFESSEYDLDVGAAGTYAANWVLAAGQWAMAAAGFKPAAPSGPSTAQTIPALTQGTPHIGYFTKYV